MKTEEYMEYTLWYDSGEGIAGAGPLPVVCIHSFRGNGEDVWKACREAGCPPFALVSVNNPGSGLDDELSPWPAEGVWKGQAPYKGLATEHLKWLTEQCLPEAEARIAAMATAADATGNSIRECQDGSQDRQPQFLPIIAGYSLAGLFALWAAWHSGYFKRVASVSGSMWYPGFKEYIRDNSPRSEIGMAYFSLGDKESHTSHPLMGQVDICTASIVESVRSRCPATVFEWNRGNHFDHPELRMARAIAWLLR